MYNPADDDRDIAYYAKIWELLRRNKEFKDIILKIEQSVTSSSNPIEARGVLRNSVLEVWDVIIRDVIGRLIATIVYTSPEYADSFSNILKPIISPLLELDWANLPERYRDLIKETITPQKILPDSLLRATLKGAMGEVIFQEDESKEAQADSIALDKEIMNHICSRYILFAIPRIYMTPKKLNDFTNEIKKSLKDGAEIPCNTLEQGHFGSPEQWLHYLAFEEAYNEDYYELVKDEPTKFPFGLTEDEFKAYCNDGWEDLYKDKTEEVRIDRISEFCADVIKIHAFTQKIYPNFGDLLEDLSKRA